MNGIVVCGMLLSAQGGANAEFASKMPFMGGTTTQMMEYRSSASGRPNFVARIDPIGGVGPWNLRNEKGEFGAVQTSLWRIVFDPSATRRVRLLDTAAETVATHPIDAFSPQVLCYQDYMGILIGTQRNAPVTTKLTRMPASRVFSLSGEFRLKELQNLGFGKKIEFSWIVANHQFSCRVSNVEDRPFLEALAKAGSYRLKETESEFRFTLDPKSLRSLLENTKAIYGVIDDKNYWGARIALKFAILPKLSDADLEALSNEKSFNVEVRPGTEVESAVQKVIGLWKSRSPDLPIPIKRNGSVRVNVHSFANVSIEIELENGTFISI